MIYDPPDHRAPLALLEPQLPQPPPPPPSSLPPSSLPPLSLPLSSSSSSAAPFDIPLSHHTNKHNTILTTGARLTAPQPQPLPHPSQFTTGSSLRTASDTRPYHNPTHFYYSAGPPESGPRGHHIMLADHQRLPLKDTHFHQQHQHQPPPSSLVDSLLSRRHDHHQQQQQEHLERRRSSTTTTPPASLLNPDSLLLYPRHHQTQPSHRTTTTTTPSSSKPFPCNGNQRSLVAAADGLPAARRDPHATHGNGGPCPTGPDSFLPSPTATTENQSNNNDARSAASHTNNGSIVPLSSTTTTTTHSFNLNDIKFNFAVPTGGASNRKQQQQQQRDLAYPTSLMAGNNHGRPSAGFGQGSGAMFAGSTNDQWLFHGGEAASEDYGHNANSDQGRFMCHGNPAPPPNPLPSDTVSVKVEFGSQQQQQQQQQQSSHPTMRDLPPKQQGFQSSYGDVHHHTVPPLHPSSSITRGSPPTPNGSNPASLLSSAFPLPRYQASSTHYPYYQPQAQVVSDTSSYPRELTAPLPTQLSYSSSPFPSHRPPQQQREQPQQQPPRPYQSSQQSPYPPFMVPPSPAPNHHSRHQRALPQHLPHVNTNLSSSSSSASCSCPLLTPLSLSSASSGGHSSVGSSLPHYHRSHHHHHHQPPPLPPPVPPHAARPHSPHTPQSPLDSHGGPDQPARERRFACPDCPKRFLRRQDLSRHSATHLNGFKPFRCSHCGTGFTRQDALHRHGKAKRCASQRGMEMEVAGVNLSPHHSHHDDQLRGLDQQHHHHNHHQQQQQQQQHLQQHQHHHMSEPPIFSSSTGQGRD